MHAVAEKILHSVEFRINTRLVLFESYRIEKKLFLQFLSNDCLMNS